jgi:hypothetical protein
MARRATGAWLQVVTGQRGAVGLRVRSRNRWKQQKFILLSLAF